jgi:serine protease Do
MAKMVMDSLISKGKVTRGWLGVGIQNLSEDLAGSFDYPSTEGALVGHVDVKGPAKKAGLQQGDIIIQLGNEKIKNVNQLRNYVASLKPGTSMDVLLVREGRKETKRVMIGELPTQSEEAPIVPNGENSDLGLTVEEFDENSPRKPRSGRRRGIMVTEIDPQGIAAKADIQPGDVVVSVNGALVSTLEEFREAVAKGNVKKGIRLIVDSQGMERFALLRDTSESSEK